MRVDRTITTLGGVLAALLFTAVGAAPAVAQQDALREAVAVYDAAQYDRAIELLHEVNTGAGSDPATRREALRYLARACTAKRAYDDARRALDALLSLEPPLVELDPEIENPHLVRLYYEARRDRQGYDVERPDPGMKTLAIMDFSNSSLHERATYEPLEEGFASMMGHYLGGATDLKVVERERVQWLLDELQLQRDTTVVDEATAVRTGKVLGVHVVLFGSYTVHENTMRIGARLVKVETSEVILSEHLFGKPDDFFELIERLSLQVAQAVNVTLERSDVQGRRATRSLDAMLAYSEGLVLLERDRFDEAHARFEQAAEYDPDYTQARQRAESLRPLLASSR
ncbi:MAG: hypothetical protein ABJF88_11180 [Rhodothermales bacterium]